MVWGFGLGVVLGTDGLGRGLDWGGGVTTGLGGGLGSGLG